MIYIILIWVNWRVIYQANRRWTWKPKKSHRKLGVETSPFRGVSRRLFPSLVCPPVVSSRYGASEKSMARWMKLYWGKGFSIANMIACGVGCSKGVFSINACICSTLFPLIWFRRKHQCVHDTGNFFFCFAFFQFVNITLSLFEQLVAWMIRSDGRNPTNSKSLVLLRSPLNGRWSCSHGSCNLKGMIFLNSFWVFPSKNIEATFQIPIDSPGKCMVEHHWTSASLWNLHVCCPKNIFPFHGSSGIEEWIKVEAAPEGFFSQKKWWELFGSRVQGTWPSHLFTFHPLKGRPGGPDFNSWYGLVNEHLSTRQTAKKRENISRLGKKAGSWYTEPMEWHNLTIDTDRLAGCLFPAPRILVKLSETEEMNVFFCPFARNESTWCWFLGNLCGDIPSLHAGM